MAPGNAPMSSGRRKKPTSTPQSVIVEAPHNTAAVKPSSQQSKQPVKPHRVDFTHAREEQEESCPTRNSSAAMPPLALRQLDGRKLQLMSAANAARLAALQASVAALDPRRAAAAAGAASALAAASAVRESAEVIERETLADCAAVLARLRAAEAAHVDLVTSRASQLAGEVASIDALNAALAAAMAAGRFDCSADAPDAAWRAISEEADLLAARAQPFVEEATSVASVVATLPREAAARADAVSRLSGFMSLVADKDLLLSKLLRERDALLARLDKNGASCEHCSMCKRPSSSAATASLPVSSLTAAGAATVSTSAATMSTATAATVERPHLRAAAATAGAGAARDPAMPALAASPFWVRLADELSVELGVAAAALRALPPG